MTPICESLSDGAVPLDGWARLTMRLKATRSSTSRAAVSRRRVDELGGSWLKGIVFGSCAKPAMLRMAATMRTTRAAMVSRICE